MLRKIKKLVFPMGTKRYCLLPNRCAGASHEYTIGPKDVIYALLADELGTSNPDDLECELLRRRFISWVRRIGDTRNRPQPITGTLSSTDAVSVGQKEHFLDQVAIQTTSEIPEPDPELESGSEEKPTKTEEKPEKTDEELVQEAVNQLLETVKADERELFREYLNKHPDLARAAIRNDVTVALYVDPTGKVGACWKNL